MLSQYVLVIVAAAFLGAALFRMSRGSGVSHPQVRTWLLVAAIFAIVSGWLFMRP